MARRSLADIMAKPPEVNRAKLDATTEEDIARHAREDDSETTPETLAQFPSVEPPAAVRKRLGLSQEAFARKLAIPVATLRNWEQGRTSPDPVARSLLAAVAREPETVFRLIAG